MKPSWYFQWAVDQGASDGDAQAFMDVSDPSLEAKIIALLEAVEETDLELRAWLDENGEQVFRYNEVGDTDAILRAAIAVKEASE